ncbi:MAG: hypothetical protein IH623_17440 [Verrucomicrobia bacterium]|nr:hypothetical protein [Verrucomicrobiota bacterium]
MRMRLLTNEVRYVYPVRYNCLLQSWRLRTGHPWAVLDSSERLSHGVNDGMLVVQERDANNVARVSYTRGTDLSGSLQDAGGIGGLLARTDHSTLNLQPSTAHTYYHADGNGNITALVNTNGAVVARYQYAPYGNLLGMAGPLAEANVYRFSNKEWHANAGQYYYGFRFYEPNLQRWLNPDPIGKMGKRSPAWGFLLPDGIPCSP